MQAGSQSMTPFLLEAPLFALCLSGKVWSAGQEASTFSFVNVSFLPLNIDLCP